MAEDRNKPTPDEIEKKIKQGIIDDWSVAHPPQYDPPRGKKERPNERKR